MVQKDSSDEETSAAPQEEDEFDKLLQQQIDKARATPAPGSVKKVMDTPKQDRLVSCSFIFFLATDRGPHVLVPGNISMIQFRLAL